MSVIFDHEPLPDRVCGCYVDMVPCLAPATWHYRIHWQGRTRQSYSCEEHHPIAVQVCFDHHRIGESCGVPGSEWVPRTPGESFCHLPEETAAQLARLHLTDLIPA